MNLTQIYERLRQQAERNGQDIDEGRLRQQAWMMRDRMMFEQSFTNNVPSSSSAGAGGGSGLRRKNNIVVGVFNQSYIITWVDTADDTWKIAVFNFDTGELSEITNTELIYNNNDEWYLYDNYLHIQNGGFSISYQNDITSKYKIFFINVNGNVQGIKDLDTNEDFQYTKNAQGYLGNLNSISTLHHFTNTGVNTHQFIGIDVNDIEIDDGSEDDVTKDGSMIVEAPDNQNFYIARPNGDLIDITQYLSGVDNYRLDYNTDFIIARISNQNINVVSQEGNLLNNFDLSSFGDISQNTATLFGENCAYYNFIVDGENYNLMVVYDGDDNRFITSTYSSRNYDYRTYTERSWYDPYSSFGKSVVISSYDDDEISNNNIGIISNNVELSWLPKGKESFYKHTFEENTLFILGDEDLNSNRTFTHGENPIVMFATESNINVAFLTENGLVTESTGITASSCTNIWGHNIGEKTFAVFDIIENNNRIWQIYGTNSIEAEVITTESWKWGSDDRYSNRNGTLVVIDSGDPSASNSFFYTPQTGVQNLPVNVGEVYNERTHGNRTGISDDYQVVTKTNNSNEVEGFYTVSRSGLSDYIDLLTLLNASNYYINSEYDVVIGDNIISFKLLITGHAASRVLVFNKLTLELIHDTGNIQPNQIRQFSDRTLIEITNGNDTTLTFIHKSGVENLSISQSNLSYESNDAYDND
jgi:hypothetical protein